jgi:hypothetical protein
MCIVFASCSDKSTKSEPDLTGEINGVSYYKIKYPSGMDIDDLFEIKDSSVGDYQVCEPVSVTNPNETFVVHGCNLENGKGVVYGDKSSDKDFFIFFDGKIGDKSMYSLSLNMIDDNAMEYAEGEQYISKYIK